MTLVGSGNRAAKYAEDYVTVHREFVDFIASLSDQQWRLTGNNFPERLNDEDEDRSVGVIAYHVADAEQFIIDRIYQMLEGKTLRPTNFRDSNAKQAHDHANVTREEVLHLLRVNEDSIPPRVRAIPEDALDVVHETPVGPATIAQRLERTLIGHMKTHRGSIEAALTLEHS